MRSKSTNSPWNVASSSAQMARIALTRSAISAKRRLGSAPWLAISSRFHPAPTPNRKRPAESWSRVATVFASTIGSCSTTSEMAVPTLSVVVAAAALISATKGS